jgi:DinB superfamily
MNDWGAATYGQPCRECAFDWSITLDDAVTLMSSVAPDYQELLADATGAEQHPDVAWPVASYVSHVADNLRIWAERLRGIELGAPHSVGEYDQDALAQARNYAMIPLQAALWSLQLSVAEWLRAVEEASSLGPVMTHPDRGELDLRNVVTSTTHDAHHHLWDIRRSLAVAGHEASP